ncbi:MAG: autotransporter assembly complex protein TamA, partial [Massilia sp.]
MAQIAATVFTLLAADAATAQGIDYRVVIDAPGPLATLLEDNLDLLRWRGNPRVDQEQLQRLVKAAPEQAKVLIATEGYYSPTVSAGLDTSGSTPVVRVLVEPGEPVLVGDVDLVLQGFAPVGGAPAFNPADLRARWALGVGQRFRQADWEGAKRGLLRQVMQARYPRAQLLDSSATVDPELHKALLKVVIDSGPEVHFGALRIEGLKRYPASVINNVNTVKVDQE